MDNYMHSICEALDLISGRWKQRGRKRWTQFCWEYLHVITRPNGYSTKHARKRMCTCYVQPVRGVCPSSHRNHNSRLCRQKEGLHIFHTGNVSTSWVSLMKSSLCNLLIFSIMCNLSQRVSSFWTVLPSPRFLSITFIIYIYIDCKDLLSTVHS